MTQYKGDSNICGSHDIGHVHKETTNRSFYSIQKNEGI